MRNGDARALLGSAVRFKLDERVRDRIVAETRGNPLALLELPRGLTAAQLAGGFGLLGARGLSERIEESFLRQLEPLPDDARRLLLLAAAEPLGDPLLLLARGRAVRHRADRRRRGDGGRAAGDRRARDVPSSAGALRRLPIGGGGGAPRRPSRAGGGDRPGRRPGPPGVASGGGGGGTGRAGRARSSSARPSGRRRAAAWPPRPRSCSVRSR